MYNQRPNFCQLKLLHPLHAAAGNITDAANKGSRACSQYYKTFFGGNLEILDFP